MSVIDILTRVDAICQKYDKYDLDKQKDLNVSGDDAFARLYASVESDIDAALQKAEAASKEKNRASAVAMPRFAAPKLDCSRRSLNCRDWL
ncbi:hypothetical protein ACSBR1_002975 [Camellia fascicularis]